MVRLLVSPFPQLLANSYPKYAMQHCDTSSDREYLFQLEHRPANHEHTSASTISDAHGPQEKITPHISLLNGRLHDDLRNSVETPLIHSAV